ncbi:MAG: response regulator transcription factor [Dehalococcoidia bacterium]
MKFLVIDDSPEIVEAVSLCLGLRWPQAKFLSTSEGKKGLKLVEEEGPDLVILDIGLPDINGLDVLKSLRDVSEVPVVMLTVRNQDVEIARFLEEGADDFVVKPFSHVELMGRVQAIFRRTQGRVHSNSQPLQAGELLMDFGAAEVYREGELVNLTRTEMALLTHLVKNATRVVTYESLASNIFQVNSPADTDSRLIKVHVQHLRTKLGDSADNPKYIANVYGTGYKFLPQVASALVADNHRNGRRNGH